MLPDILKSFSTNARFLSRSTHFLRQCLFIVAAGTNDCGYPQALLKFAFDVQKSIAFSL
jgi:hypothetical protein